MLDLVYINGDFYPRSEASISVFDRGFLFSDGVYDMVPVLHGSFFTAKAHIERLIRSANSIRIDSPLSPDEWVEACKRFLTVNQADESTHGSIYIQVTRGNQGTRNHRPNKDLIPTVVMFWLPLSDTPDPHHKGIKAITTEDKRRKDCSFKATGLLPNILASFEAEDEGCYEAILVRDHWVQEGTTSNVFAVINGELITPPLTRSVLPGVTRALVLEMATHLGIPCREEPLHENSLADCSELWISGSRKDIYPVVLLNHKPVGDGKTGPIWQTLMNAFHERKKETLT